MKGLPENFPDRNVAIMGMGYVGLTLAVAMAEVGFRTLGIEIRDEVVRQLIGGTPHFHEQGLPERLPRVLDDGFLTVHRTVPEDIRVSVYIITVGTPLGDNSMVRVDMIERVSRQVASHLRDGDLVIMRSTVKVGTTRQIVEPILDHSGKSFDLAFCPERTLEGNALEEIRQLPQIVAGRSHKASVRAAQLFQLLTPTVVRVADVETAEMIKMIDNAHRDVQFAYANEVARLCDAVGISASEVISAGKLGYPRTSLPMPGPVGGPCLSKDPYILAEGLAPLGAEPEITLAARRINERQPFEIAQHLHSVLRALDDWPQDPIISLLGLAFKGIPATDDMRGTMALPLRAALKDLFINARFRGFDPEIAEPAIKEAGFEPMASIEDSIEGANLVIIANNHPVFSKLPLEDLAEALGRPGLFYDCWNHFSASDLRLPTGTGYMALGSHGKAVLPRTTER